MNSILKVKKQDGTWVDIDAIQGETGKSAYEYAVDGGYKGTEEQFIAFLNGNLTDAGIEGSHLTDFGNPHQVTTEQIGAVPNIDFTVHVGSDNPHEITPSIIGAASKSEADKLREDVNYLSEVLHKAGTLTEDEYKSITGDEEVEN